MKRTIVLGMLVLPLITVGCGGSGGKIVDVPFTGLKFNCDKEEVLRESDQTMFNTYVPSDKWLDKDSFAQALKEQDQNGNLARMNSLEEFTNEAWSSIESFAKEECSN